MEKNTVTTILQIYKRIEYLEEQLAAIDAQTIKSSKIFIIHNEGGVEFDKKIDREDVQYIYANPNTKFHLRFAVGLLCNTEYVFFFDDDTIPGNRLFESAMNIINKHNCIVVGNGRIIHEKEQSWDCPGWGSQNETEIECDFGGHFWGMKTEHLKYMWFERPIRLDNCEDMQLSFNCFRFGNIHTFVLPHPDSNKSIWSSLKGREYGSDSVASWKVNKSHFIDRWEVIREYSKRGYITLLKRNV